MYISGRVLVVSYFIKAIEVDLLPRQVPHKPQEYPAKHGNSIPSPPGEPGEIPPEPPESLAF